ncbi:MAG: hypothetical protein OES38_13840 [Gammaproteobacteria bacterium]|nr:hypothetical protein [Gammaproteobacteria bacterium]
MKKTTQMIQKFIWLLLPVFVIASFNVRADSHEAPPAPAALEAFSCTYNPGKDRGDLDSAISFHKKQAEKAGMAIPDSFLWTHVKGTAPVDMVWLTVHESLVAYGAFADASAASDDMLAIRPRYDTVVTCQDGLAVAIPVIAPDPESDGPDVAALATYACNFQHGSGPADLPDLASHIAGTNAGMGDAALDAAYQFTPLTGGPDGADVVLVGVAASTEKWATNQAMLNTTPAGQSLVRHFNAVVDCGMNLWASEQVFGGDG